ncbi:MAG TPA: 50S ribosomal protein L29 [Brevefilum fermentans]|jgi:large subunit ribosomal protein L29|uniref:Large ribosomal subunit protein uL29 n=1 Tax=Candidatus Brevifilum fermentans TaxID=1986204 RepID=A0A1Y6K1M7_9CHLR|nr:50S ribosomal protein L29 [Brevefilum fermentans]MDI9566371.1 50S ribosomal protein L29 [Chloroflexota bacterium]OQB86525.1 MAG: 50S ribosomal protein L29 [Chloroflexi bacterium ADurb.Bin120]SMX53595.1 50S ribosomal protein L29 [Brevefilum fermentans]HOM67587.1 50S ribosomal protein L29 [Brevefilum fermentans]HPX95624.1 50S ribosomal protein L29 [Brevefilum fermentans]
MKAAEIRKMKIPQIEEALMDARHELLNLRFQTITGQLTDTSRIRFVRRDIARMETILREKQLAEMAEESEA